MWNFKYKDAYLPFVWDILEDTAVQSMRRLPQHVKGVSCYHHSVLVSYISFRLCSVCGLDARAAARGGLLHDLYLYNWRDKACHPEFNHTLHHPAVALRNARSRFFLTRKEANIIESHMFPLTIARPHRSLEAFIVGMVDKFCALAEVLRLIPLLTPTEEIPVQKAPITFRNKAPRLRVRAS